MSIDRAALVLAELPARELGPWLAVALTPVALVVAWRIRALDSRSVAGPSRLDPSVGSPAALWLSAVIAFFAWLAVQATYVQAVHGAELEAVRQSAASKPASQSEAGPTTRDANSILQPRETVVLAAGSQVFGFAVLLIADARLLKPGGLKRLGLVGGHAARALAPGLLGAIVALPLTWLVIVITEFAWQQAGFRPPQDHQLIRMLRVSPAADLKILVAVSAALCAPVFEEALFRGHVQTALSAWIAGLLRQAKPELTETDLPIWPRWLAIGVTAILFALVHEAGWMIPPLFVLAVCLGYAYERTGNLWVPVVMHAIFNAVSVTWVLAS